MNLTDIKDQAKSDSKNGMNFASVSPIDVLRLVAVAEAAMEFRDALFNEQDAKKYMAIRAKVFDEALAGVTR